ncbi:dihydropteroate synthase [Acinetobacter larvae]|uniref:Dihydropteroate synthase n=1 Tax=Acinetobacter larvae TaxID=1789224 RepID=A0A1B2LXS3_9GAMM|nr:dihydropteroate synthase [Acinetobacter larvae]AOA57736.1 dihydropteroate synthase [Acinetobacter larvae]
MRLMSLPQRYLQCREKTLDLSKPHIMGILNVTPDSFSDGGRYLDQNKAIAHAQEMITAGASIIDIGGESTRPGAAKVSVEQELQRIIPVVQALHGLDVVLSIDTSTPEVIEAAVAQGAHIWNDVRALKRPGALEMAAQLAIPVIMMHMRGEPDNMQQFAQYDELCDEIIFELKERISAAIEMGVQRDHILIDPGFGFAKDTTQNLALLRQLYRLNELGFPLVSALSRKRFIGDVLGGVDAPQRVLASVTAHLISIQQGACIVRAHDVAEMKQAIVLWQAMQATTIT